MSLYCELQVNGERIGAVRAVRVAGQDGTYPDDVNAYDATVVDEDHTTLWRGRVWHRYGDGAWGLVTAATNAMRAEASSR
ncbi:hypothetical protein ACFXG4_27290 [Nocardia sp. NPDC059246]|uniref:hypothetical protein n=1 Tax=unclassified Nocardia TaxID=2637762 RepID=UPI0036B32441